MEPTIDPNAAIRQRTYLSYSIAGPVGVLAVIGLRTSAPLSGVLQWTVMLVVTAGGLTLGWMASASLRRTEPLPSRTRLTLSAIGIAVVAGPVAQRYLDTKVDANAVFWTVGLLLTAMTASFFGRETWARRH